MDRDKKLALLNQLMDELIDGIAAAIQSGEELPDELQALLAQELDATFNEIQALQGESSTAQPTTQEESPMSADAQLLWILSGQNPQSFISYLRSYPSAATTALLKNPAQLNATIEQLSQMMPHGQPPVMDGIPHSDLQSSNIWGSKYDPKTGKMTVRFQEGAEYEYDGVPPNIYRAFASGNASAKTKGSNQFGRWWPNKNPSLGAALNQYIKAGKFNYRKIK